MARKTESNSVADTLRRLFGHDDDRKLVSSKYADRSPLRKHQVDPGKRPLVFKRSMSCDNLIKNLLALDSVFNSQDLVCALAEGRVPAAELHAEIDRAKARMEQKMRAYGYWFDRLNALGDILKEKPSLEDFALEDHLVVDGQSHTMGTPYALRAVQLLEKVEEQGRRSLLGPEQLAEKAWALYRLGLVDQAVVAARQALEAEPELAEAWRLLATQYLSERRAADREVLRYRFEREDADPESAHERWAEEMQGTAEARRSQALTEHRSVVFQALLHWPKDGESPGRCYRYRENYEQIRNWCIDWLFVLTQPGSEGHLTAVEMQVATQIGAEWNAYAAEHPYTPTDVYFFQAGWWQPNRHLTKLKLLHVRSVLGLPGYEAARQDFFKALREGVHGELLSEMLQRQDLLKALARHGCAADLDELMSHFACFVEAVDQEQQKNLSLLKGNLLRRAYHEAFVRAEFSHCLRVAREAQTFLAQYPGFEPQELGLDDLQSNTLGVKHWKYLELRAAIEIAGESPEARYTLLSVAQPAQYFADEADYLIAEVLNEFDDQCHVAPYGDSILTNGQWLKAVRRIHRAGGYADPEAKSSVEKLIAQLAGLAVEEKALPTPGDFDYYR